MKKLMILALLAGVTTTHVHAEDSPAPANTISKEELNAAIKAKLDEMISFKGDFRFRYESIDKEGSDTRDRFRIRLRLQADANVSDQLKATVGIASGSDDPVSSNQTLDDGFSSKDIQLDLAYLTITPKNAEGMDIFLGKMKNPFISVNSLIWDSDLRPEGGAVNYELPLGDKLTLALNAGAFSVEERSSEDDTMLYGGQVAIKSKGDKVSLTTGASYYYYDNIEGFDPIYDDTDSFGNTTVDVIDPDTGDVTGIVYADGFEILELFATAGFDAGIPVSIDGSYVVNNDASTDDTGYQAGIKLGKLKKAGTYDFGYAYRRLEANAVLGAFTDSDAYGGGTDGKSHIIFAGYQLTDDLTGRITYYTGEAGLSDGVNYDRLMVDLSAKF